MASLRAYCALFPTPECIHGGGDPERRARRTQARVGTTRPLILLMLVSVRAAARSVSLDIPALVIDIEWAAAL